jgi:Xaa-Pro aminopeptidase
MTRLFMGLLLALLCPAFSLAQPVFSTVFPAQEYAERRAKVLAQIGDGVAIIQGATEPPGEQPFRQSNQFAYLCGIFEPRAILVLDGKTRRATAYLQPLVAHDLESKFGPGMVTPGAEATRQTGLDETLPRDQFGAALSGLAREHRTLYTPFRPEVLGESSNFDVVRLNRLNLADPWDGRLSREAHFRERLAGAAPFSEIRDLDPILDRLRGIKSPREIALIRETTEITAAGMERAMQRAHPGMFEYQIQAEIEYTFKFRGSLGTSYYALIATGQNTWYTHYHRNTAQLMNGDIVQIDDAPDFKGYTSDLSRVFPANGVWTPVQRERYTLYLECYRALLTSIAPGKTPREILTRASARMDAIIAAHTFSVDATGRATREAFQQYLQKDKDSLSSVQPFALGHGVGMEVHDDVYEKSALLDRLQPGQVFTIEPAIRFADDHTGMRIEDILLVTDSGIENLSASLPEDPDAIQALMSSALPAGARQP